METMEVTRGTYSRATRGGGVLVGPTDQLDTVNRTWWPSTWGAVSAEAVMDRLIMDPLYRIRLAVLNNPQDVLSNYNRSYAVSGGLGAEELLVKLQNLWNDGWHQAVMVILDVPWVRGRNAILDEVYDAGEAETNATEGQEVAEQWAKMFPSLNLSSDSLGLGQMFTALAAIGGGRRAQRAAEADATRIAAQSAAQAQIDAAHKDRMMMWIKWGGAALATIALITLVIWYLRK